VMELSSLLLKGDRLIILDAVATGVAEDIVMVSGEATDIACRLGAVTLGVVGGGTTITGDDRLADIQETTFADGSFVWGIGESILEVFHFLQPFVVLDLLMVLQLGQFKLFVLCFYVIFEFLLEGGQFFKDYLVLSV
jgi:hypothetical protein